MRFVNCNILSHRDDQDATGSTIDANQLISASFHIIPGKGDDAGTLKIQASNDPNTGDNNSPVNWVDIPNQSSSISSGGAALLTISQLSYRWIRATYTHSGGGSSSTLMLVNMMALSV